MMPRWNLLPVLITSMMALLTGCNALWFLAEEATATPEPTVTERPATPTATVEPTTPPEMAAFPLAADMYYLRDGRVWRQPAAGDETTAEGVTPSSVSIADFAIAPGNDWLATVDTAGQISISSADGSRSVFISDQGLRPDALRFGQQSVAWSPDGRRLAYITQDGFQAYYPGAGIDGTPIIFRPDEAAITDLRWEKNGAWLYVQRADGTAALYQGEPILSLFAELGPVQDALWLRDGRLAFAPEQGGLALLQPTDLEARRFIVPQGRFISRVQQRRDGTLVFFVHEDNIDTQGFLHTANPADLSFSPQSAVGVLTSDKIWNPAGMRMVSYQQQTITLLDPETGSQARFEARSFLTELRWGSLLPETVRGIALPTDLYFLSPQSDVVQVWRLPADGEPPEALTNAEEDITDFAISQDGTQIAYTSGRTIYRVVLNISPDTAIIEFESDTERLDGQPAFDPSGRQLAYTDDGLWIVDLTEAEPTPRRIIGSRQPEGFGQERLVEVYSRPRWSPEGNLLLADVAFFEGSSLAVVPITNRLNAVPIQLDLFGHRGQWLEDNRILATSRGALYDNPGIRVIESMAETDDDAPPVFEPNTASIAAEPAEQAQLTDDGRILFLRSGDQFIEGPNSVVVLSTDETGAGTLTESEAIVLESPRLSPDGQTLAGLVDTERRDGDIVTGRILINDVRSGASVIIDGIADAHALQWATP